MVPERYNDTVDVNQTQGPPQYQPTYREDILSTVQVPDKYQALRSRIADVPTKYQPQISELRRIYSRSLGLSEPIIQI